MNDDLRARAERIAESLTTAWNEGDGGAFGRSFSLDADFVNIFGMYFTGREAISEQHQRIFDSIYKASRIVFTISHLRSLGDSLALAHVKSTLWVDDGPLAGEMHTLATAILKRETSDWRIAAFQNTREQAPPGPKPAAAPAG